MQDNFEIYENLIMKIGTVMNSEADSLVVDGKLCDETFKKMDKLARLAARLSLVRSRLLAEKRKMEKQKEQEMQQKKEKSYIRGGIENCPEVLARPDLQEVIRKMKKDIIENPEKHKEYDPERMRKEFEENPIPKVQQVF